MPDSKVNEYLSNVLDRLLEVVDLVVGKEKAQTTKDIFTRYHTELQESLDRSENIDEVVSSVNHYINSILSVVETFGLNEKQYRSTKKLMLDQIYGCRKNIIVPFYEKLFKSTKKVEL